MTNLPSPPAEPFLPLFNSSNNNNNHEEGDNDSLLLLPQQQQQQQQQQQSFSTGTSHISSNSVNPAQVQSPSTETAVNDLKTPPPFSSCDEHEWIVDMDDSAVDEPLTVVWENYSQVQSFLTTVDGVLSAADKNDTKTTTMTPQQEQQPLYLFRNNTNNNKNDNTDGCALEEDSHGNVIIPRPAVFQQTDVTNTQFLGVMLDRAASHWCCIGFKVAPISLDLIGIHVRHTTPAPILYCIAAIILVSDPHQTRFSTQAKDMAMALYLKARRSVDDVLFVDDQLDASTIQCYFCLSYTSNLLRLYEHQRTWGSLAAIALRRQLLSPPPPPPPPPPSSSSSSSSSLPRAAESGVPGHVYSSAWVSCWRRWYYVDAWMSLTMHRERLLPDTTVVEGHDILFSPPPLLPEQRQQEYWRPTSGDDDDYLQHFAVLAHFIRRYLRAFESQQLTSIEAPAYKNITHALESWYHQLPYDNSNPLPNPTGFTPRVDIHLHLCYHAVRLVLFSRFLESHNHHTNQQQQQGKPSLSLLRLMRDVLDTNIQLLQALQQLKSNGCDQSTYHRLFLAIHKSAYCVYQNLEARQQQNNISIASATTTAVGENNVEKRLRCLAAEQLEMNLELLKCTPAYFNDTFNMRAFATTCLGEIQKLGLPLLPSLSDHCQKQQQQQQKQPKTWQQQRQLIQQRRRRLFSAAIHPYVSVFRVQDPFDIDRRETVSITDSDSSCQKKRRASTTNSSSSSRGTMLPQQQ